MIDSFTVTFGTKYLTGTSVLPYETFSLIQENILHQSKNCKNHFENSPFSCRRGVLDTILCDKVCELLVACLWFYPGTDRHDFTEILLNVALNTLTHGRNCIP